MTPEKVSHPFTPAEIVADAMMAAIYMQVRYPREESEKAADQYPEHVREELLDATFTAWTRRKCQAASAYTLCKIAAHSASDSLFDRYVLMQSWDDKHTKANGDPLFNHAYFLVRDKSSVWYMGSPSNYAMHERTRLTTLFKNKERLMSKLFTGDLTTLEKEYRVHLPYYNSPWPKASEIQYLVDHTKSVIPQMTRDPASPFEHEMTLFTINAGHSLVWGKMTLNVDFRLQLDELE